jgi:squalene-hopene/tetraprenyl-beta-curcumene cyclase
LNRPFHARDAVLTEGAAPSGLRSLKFDRLASVSALDRTIQSARDSLLNTQAAEGYWLYELEADCTIPSEYIMMMHYLDEIDTVLEAKIANYLRSHQADHGGWPLYYGGEFDISCTVKAYLALKLAGDSPDAPHMRRARAAIL